MAMSVWKIATPAQWRGMQSGAARQDFAMSEKSSGKSSPAVAKRGLSQPHVAVVRAEVQAVGLRHSWTQDSEVPRLDRRTFLEYGKSISVVSSG